MTILCSMRLRRMAAAAWFLILGLGYCQTLVAETTEAAGAPTIASTSGARDSTFMTTTMYIEKCKKAGFDPLQLACSTCSILPASVQDTCQFCCQSYKTLDAQATRYVGAILVDTGSSQALQEFINEDRELVWKQKKGIQRKEIDVGGGGGGMFQFYAQPSLVLWYDKDPPSETGSLEKLSKAAVEITTLDGLGRDDIREMLLALLPDK